MGCVSDWTWGLKRDAFSAAKEVIMTIRTAHILLITVAVVGGLTFTGSAVSRALSDSPQGSWAVVAASLAATIGLAAYLRSYASRGADEAQSSEAK